MCHVWEEIIILAGEGGRITLFGSKSLDGSWIFMKETNETLLADILDGEDLSIIVHQKSKEVSDWERAIALLGRSWTDLLPRYVHPEFKQQVWREVISKDEISHLRYWECLCFEE